RRDESLFPSDDSRLRTAEEFIAAEANKIGAGFQRVARRGLMLGNSQRFSRDHRAAPEIFDKRNPVLLRQRPDLFRRRRFYNAAAQLFTTVAASVSQSNASALST